MHKVYILLIQLLPHHLISRCLLYVSRVETKWFKRLLISHYQKAFGIDLKDALEGSPNAYPSLNAFFTRALKPEARPMATGNVLVSPVDGRISQIGRLKSDQLLQAKGINYSLTALLGGNATQAETFSGGSYATIYLSPSDYHRIHMPSNGVLTDMTHVPGRLFSVSPYSVSHIDGLFARNERVVCLFDTEAGRMALILVGAINVAAIETTWAGLVTPPRGKAVQHESYDGTLQLRRGMEMGRFNMGSTVIILMEKDAPAWREELTAEVAVKMGQALT